ncbi:MAG: diacylglycerol kinase [Pirellulaceae bacterium]
MLLAAISIVVLSELINTSIEHVSRAVTTEYDQNIETARYCKRDLYCLPRGANSGGL